MTPVATPSLVTLFRQTGQPSVFGGGRGSDATVGKDTPVGSLPPNARGVDIGKLRELRSRSDFKRSREFDLLLDLVIRSEGRVSPAELLEVLPLRRVESRDAAGRVTTVAYHYKGQHRVTFNRAGAKDLGARTPNARSLSGSPAALVAAMESEPAATAEEVEGAIAALDAMEYEVWQAYDQELQAQAEWEAWIASQPVGNQVCPDAPSSSATRVTLVGNTMGHRCTDAFVAAATSLASTATGIGAIKAGAAASWATALATGSTIAAAATVGWVVGGATLIAGTGYFIYQALHCRAPVQPTHNESLFQQRTGAERFALSGFENRERWVGGNAKPRRFA